MLHVIKTITIILLTVTELIFSQSGTPVNSFGVNGEVKYGFNRFKYANDYGGQVQITKDNKIMVFGCNTDSTDAYYSFIRLNNDGSLDKSFNDTGKLLIKANTSLKNVIDIKFLLDSTDNFILIGKLDTNKCFVEKLLNSEAPGALGTTIWKLSLSDCFDIKKIEKSVSFGDNKLLIAGQCTDNYHAKIICLKTSGELDTTFGSGGQQVFSTTNLDRYSFSFDIDSKTNVLVAWDSSCWSSECGHIYSSRYTYQGILDKTYGSNGVFEYHYYLGRYGSNLEDILADKTDKILLIQSYALDYCSGGRCVHLNNDASIDSSFGYGGGGGVSINHGNIIIDKNNRILSSTTGNGSCGYYECYQILSCLTIEGKSDTNFNKKGYIIIDTIIQNVPKGCYTGFMPYSMLVNSNDQILLTGTIPNINNDDFMIWRFNPNGEPDTTFNRTGQLIINGNDSYLISIPERSWATDVVKGNDEIYLFGSSYNDIDEHMMCTGEDYGIVNLKDDGSIDTSFNKTGKLVLRGKDYRTKLYYPDNSMLIVNGPGSLYKLEANGEVDTSFGIMGRANLPSLAKDVYINKIAIDTLGKIILSANGCRYLIRLDKNGMPDSSFNNNGLVNIPGPSMDNNEIFISNGNMILVGIASDKEYPIKIFCLDAYGSISSLIEIKDSIIYPNFYMDENSKIIIWGDYKTEKTSKKIISRYYLNGNIDSTFGESGYIFPDNYGQDFVRLYFVEKNPERFFLSFRNNNVICLQSNGQVDTTFGNQGNLDFYFTSYGRLLADSNFIWITKSNYFNDGFNLIKLYARNNQSIDFSLPDTIEIDSSPFKLNAITSSMLPVYYFTNDTEIADIVNDTLIIKGSGNATITALQPGNSSFYSAEPVSRDFYVISNIPSADASYSIPKLKLYPNPVSYTLFIEANSEIENVIISNIEGKTLINIPKTGKYNMQIDLNDLEAGCYILYCQFKDSTVRRLKVLKL